MEDLTPNCRWDNEIPADQSAAATAAAERTYDNVLRAMKARIFSMRLEIARQMDGCRDIDAAEAAIDAEMAARNL
jgi:hypothetical protein